MMASDVLLRPYSPSLVRSDESGTRSAGRALLEQADTKRVMLADRCSCEMLIWVMGGGCPGVLSRMLKNLYSALIQREILTGIVAHHHAVRL